MPLAALPDFRGSNRLTISGVQGEAGYRVTPTPSEGTYIVECNGSSIYIDTRTAKVSVEGCHDLKLYLAHSPLTATLEICNSQRIEVYFEDTCIVSTVSRVHVHRDEELFLLDKIEKNNKIQMFQYVCKVQVDGTFTKEPVLRENGYPTTEAKKDHYENQKRIADEYMFKSMLKDMRMEEKEMYAKLGMPPDLRPSGSQE